MTYQNFEMLKSEFNQARYSDWANWCNQSGQYSIDSDAEKYFTITIPEKSQNDLALEEINQLKAELTAEDYKITKCYEANLANEPLPYDFTQLHAERQSKRDRINLLEETLNHE